jgi:hypothetical protein
LTSVSRVIPCSQTGPAQNDIVRRFVDQVRWQGTAVAVRSYVCHDERQAIPFAFRPHSLIVIGARRSWLPTRIERLRRALERAGHFVLFVDEANRQGDDEHSRISRSAQVGEHDLQLKRRCDDSRGPGGGFFADGDIAPGVPRLKSTQHLLIVAAMVTFDSPSLR